MDKEQARFILRSFRPDGSDAGSPDFADALRLAVEDRELGEWLAKERAFDAAFADALGSVDLPQTLRADILACLAGGDVGPAAEDDENDQAWIDALATVQPPAGLRDQILTAMDRTLAPTAGPVKTFKLIRRLAIPVAIAAGIVLAFLITRQPAADAKKSAVAWQTLRSEAILTLETHGSVHEEPVPGPVALARYLADRNLPHLADLPAALKKMKGFACRELVVNGNRGALICFEGGKKNRVHLVIFRRDDVSGDFPRDGHPEFAQNGEWATARWAEGDHVAMMVSNTGTKNLAALF